MFKLRNIAPRHVHQRRILLHNAPINQRLHAEMILLHTQPLQVAPRKYQRAEVVLDDLEQRLRGCVVQVAAIRVGRGEAVAVYAGGVADRAPAGAAEGFDGEDVALFHGLGGAGFDEGDLFVAVDFIAEDLWGALTWCT